MLVKALLTVPAGAAYWRTVGNLACLRSISGGGSLHDRRQRKRECILNAYTLMLGVCTVRIGPIAACGHV
jgi:hypothetical protein